MKADNFTPGPWSNDPLQPTIWDASGDFKIATIADLPWKNGKSDWMTEQANARLIAAAPELLAACRELLENATGPAMVYGDGRGNDGKKTDLSHQEFNALRARRIEQARAAIAKAEGRI